MITTIMKPFRAVWEALVRQQRRKVHNDPDVVALREQQREAIEANQRLNEVERQYLGRGERHA